MGSVHTRLNGEGRKRALLVGVPETPYLEQHAELAERFPELDCTQQDLGLVGTALRQSHYEVTTHHPGHEEPLRQNVGRGALMGALEDFLAGCRPGDTAFVYISCHGVTMGERDYLLPSDAQPSAPGPDGRRGLRTATLLAADAAELLPPDGLPDGVTAVLCLDMCRAAESSGDQDDKDWSRGQDKNVYWLRSCGRGESSYADGDGSWFGRALAEALSPTTSPTTFKEVVEHTRAAVRRLAGSVPSARPRVDAEFPRLSDGVDGPVLCEGSREPERWTHMVTESPLWSHTSGSATVHDQVKEQLTALAQHVADGFSGKGAHRADPWHDPAYPVRVGHELAHFVERAGLEGQDRLTPAETAVLLAAPIVHEGAVAVALEELRRLLPERVDSADPQEGAVDHSVDPQEKHDADVRGAVRDTCRAHSQVLRAARTLRTRGLDEAETAADHWLRHRFVAGWDTLWERTSFYTTVDNLIDRAVSAVIAADSRSAPEPPSKARRIAIDRQVREVLGHLTVNPGSSPRISDPSQSDAWHTHPPVQGSLWRGDELARLLWLAGLLAADPRRMSSVLVDHLGAHEKLSPRKVVAALSTDFRYEDTAGRAPGHHGRAVCFHCPHPALHAAVEELAATADAALDTLHREQPSPPPLLRGLPDRITLDHLVPESDAYTQPLERFRLAEDEIRPLLMGTQLYGDKLLAIRELYQNALDAVRHRDARLRYGATQGRGQSDWRARITFTQGWDPDGRPYIECEDNGSGMSRTKLTSMFARAGKRYEQDPEFMQERRNWRRAGVTDVSLNSRFGIGVFSYFMLAEEVVVRTRSVDRFGTPGTEPAARADIQSGSGLLRISSAVDAPAEGGTRVRLYLNHGPDEELPSLVKALQSMLWVSDHDVRAVEYDERKEEVRSETWVPGTLRLAHDWHGSPVQAGEDSWLVQGKGQLLLDGVVVKDAPRVYGYVANLRERHRPEPSVDRNRLVDYDKERVSRELLDAVKVAAGQCEEVSLSWLWRLAGQSPRLVVTLLGALPGSTVAYVDTSLGGQQLEPLRQPLATTGCFPSAPNHSASLGENRYAESTLLRRWLTDRLRPAPPGRDRHMPDGYPPPHPLDPLLFLDSWPLDMARVVRASALAQCTLGEVLRALRRFAVVGLPIPEFTDIRSFRSLRPDELTADVLAAYLSAAEPMDNRTVLPDPEHWPHPPATHAPLLVTAAARGATLGQAVEALQSLRGVDSSLPPAPRLNEELMGLRPTEQEARVGGLVERQGSLTGRYRWAPGTVTPVGLLEANRSPASLTDFLRRIEQLAPLGFSVDHEPSAGARERGCLTVSERLLLSQDLNGNAPWRERHVNMQHLLRASANLGRTLGEIADSIDASADVTLVSRPEVPPEAREWAVPDWAVSHERVFSGDPHDGCRDWEFVLRAAGHDSDEVARTLHFMVLCGVMDAETDQTAVLRQIAALPDSPHLRSVLAELNVSYELDAVRALDDDGLTTGRLLQLAIRQNCTLGEAADRLATEKVHIPLRIACPPQEARSLRPRETDLLVLLEQRTAARFPDALRIRDLLTYPAAPLGPAL
ncbi:HD domain-containing protein, partial [Streptomyces boluensis]